jgi:very-short-patch-repair endonuclease
LGFTGRVVHRLVAQGQLHRVHTGVFAVGHPALTREGRWLAATLALGPGALLSHRSAAALWAILPGMQPLEVTIPTTAGRPHRDGLRVHRQLLQPRERETRHGIPVTTLARTLIDLAAVLDARTLAGAFEEAQVSHRLSPAVVAAELVGRPGCRGSRGLRALLAGAVEPGQVESVLELRFLRLCNAHGLPRPVTQARFGPWRADFWFPDGRLAVETDGGGYHATAAKHARDARKTADLQAAGVRVVRLRWAEVVGRPRVVAGHLRVALARGTTASVASGTA